MKEEKSKAAKTEAAPVSVGVGRAAREATPKFIIDLLYGESWIHDPVK